VVGRPQRIGLARPHLDVFTHGRLPCSCRRRRSGPG
jgi:hypothetical protein